jgi:endogenous inhibitor of DNA gyrase (YacG/DUF329 family)
MTCLGPIEKRAGESHSKWALRKFCSKKCKNKGITKHSATRACARCGRRFMPPAKRRGAQEFCGRECKYRNDTTRNEQRRAQRLRDGRAVLSDLAFIAGLSFQTLKQRLIGGWSLERALYAPLRQPGPRESA